ncbi:MAG: hypothetical protein LBH44_00290 [Treponema sp.]|jgi:hypothetical protein|nr:hypothetical protein [Treponema sp.]
MGQKENMNLLLQLHSIITGTHLTLEQIINRRTIDPDITLIHNTELSGKVASNGTISVKDYYTLGGQLESRASEKTG